MLSTAPFILLLQLVYLADSSILSTPANEFECDTVPPALWCANPLLSKKCGFSEICNRYTKSTSGKKLNLTVAFFSTCPSAQYLIGSESFSITYTKMSDYINVEVIILPRQTEVSHFCVFPNYLLYLGRKNCM